MSEGRRYFAWMEIGRASPDGGEPWTAWMAPLPEGGALYRILVVADGAITVTIDAQQHEGAGMRSLHRGRRHLTRMADDEAIACLLGAADEAARAALARSDRKDPVRPAPFAGNVVFLADGEACLTAAA